MISNKKIFLILVLVIGAALSACHKHSNTSVSSSVQSNVTLPADWPIPELSFTNNITLPRAPSAGSEMPDIDGLKWTTWNAYVHCDGGGIAIAKHVESRLAPLGYRRVDHVTENSDLHKWRMYYSPDGKLEITVMADVTQGLSATPDQIADTAKKWEDHDTVALANVKDFMIMINKYESPPLPYKQLLEGTYSSGNYRLVPITARK
jgi:hypothetical protein